MPVFGRRCMRDLTACILLSIFTLPSALMAQAHVVSPLDLQKETVAATQSREGHLQTVSNFLSSPTAEKAMQTAHVDPVKIENAISTLSDGELAQMAAHANKAQADFAAGNIGEHDLILIILAMVALILIIVAVR
jgi:hypothetical protein